MSPPRSHRARHRVSRRRILLLGAFAALAFQSAVASAQWATTYEVSYLPGSFNWQFRRNYPGADRLFNALDYGHGTLRETLWKYPDAPLEQLEQREFDYITRTLLARPPRLPVVTEAIEVDFAKLAPEAKAMFDWAQLLDRQVYDVWADSSTPVAEKDARVTELLGYYRSRPELAFSSVPKSMDAVDAQFYSLAFRRRYPKFNGLVWASHWLQAGLHEPLLVGRTDAERKAMVDATVGRFRQMLAGAPRSMPHVMPMTPAIAPTFARRYPEVAAIMDNLHMMNGVVADILASRDVPRSAKRREILTAARMFRSDSTSASGYDEWLSMGEKMGLNNMGGPAVGFAPELPLPTLARGMPMARMNPSPAGMPAMARGGVQHDTTPATHDMNMPGVGQRGERVDTQALLAIHRRMMADPVIRERVATDPVLRRMIAQLGSLPPGPQAMGGAPMAGMSAMASSEAQREAIEFIVRLLSDPTVESRIHSDPELHRLWSDPEVQRRLGELKAERASRRSHPAPQPPANPQPQHPGHP